MEGFLSALCFGFAILMGTMAVVLLIGTIVNIRRKKFKRQDALVGFTLFGFALFFTVFLAWVSIRML